MIEAIIDYIFQGLAVIFLAIIGTISLFLLYLAKACTTIIIGSGDFITSTIHYEIFKYMPKDWEIVWDFLHGDLFIRYLYYKSAINALSRYLIILPKE